MFPSVYGQAAKPVFGNDLDPRRLHLALSGLFCRGLGGPSWVHWSPGRYRYLRSHRRLYIGWFGVIMIPMLFAATSVGVIAFTAALSVDIDGIREPVSGSLIYGNNIIHGLPRALLLVFGG